MIPISLHPTVFCFSCLILVITWTINIVPAKKFYCRKTIFLRRFVVCGIYSLPIGESCFFFFFFRPAASCLLLIFPRNSDICSSLKGQLRSLTYLPETFGIYDHLDETSSSTTLGALNALPTFLLQAPPSSELLATLKQPFDGEITSKMPSSSRNALGVIHDYLMVSAHPSHMRRMTPSRCLPSET